ncbi:unnamed protein product [Bemisia tabaci]|uniref:Uncharacterized protein n=1 Tax=Bemisia tabaci TaxID=7038 RepID=A0A9P0AKK7_BEMTA|nr:PREDICTED: 13 kDa deflagellation-inducible protein-like [Bemisia tabaci]XP_018905155.1 PREDICTED: 13 kDa deflagellation-inducible protein-like [Bemisia tabaci]CAH0393804.1 unnamed protein product [Bemisia tabaci]
MDMMAEQGAALQLLNQELVKHIEELKRRKLYLQKCIRDDERVKCQLETEMMSLSARLQEIIVRLEHKTAAFNDVNTAISEAECAFDKILHSSQALLSVIVEEKNNIIKAIDSDCDICSRDDDCC